MTTQPAKVDRMIVYVDGFNLYNGLHDSYGTKLLWLDLVALSRSLRPANNLVRVKYFTAPVLGTDGAHQRQQQYQFALRAKNPGVIDIIQGRYQTKTMTCHKCGSTWDHREEKETDVNIAINIVGDAAADNADSMLIISADSDLVPAVKMAKQLKPSLFIAAAFPPARNSSELKKYMRASFPIGDAKIRGAQLPESFKDGLSGKSYNCPDKWK